MKIFCLKKKVHDINQNKKKAAASTAVRHVFRIFLIGLPHIRSSWVRAEQSLKG